MSARKLNHVWSLKYVIAFKMDLLHSIDGKCDSIDESDFTFLFKPFNELIFLLCWAFVRVPELINFCWF
jgi:hypothetical protein